jgi:hypothetical protein
MGHRIRPAGRERRRIEPTAAEGYPMIRIVLLLMLLGLCACADREGVAEAKRSYQG